jgi:altronate dehydratase small subunit
MYKALRLSGKDNVVTCLQATERGAAVEEGGETILATENIPKFHKMAIAPIAAGSLCYKYGEVIGVATRNIGPGEHVHVHNIESTRGRGDKQ